MEDLLNKAIPVLTKVPLSELSVFPRIRRVPVVYLNGLMGIPYSVGSALLSGYSLQA